MNAEEIFKRLCYRPFGFTVEDVQSRIDRFQGPYKYPFDYRYIVMAPFVWKIILVERAGIRSNQELTT